MHRAPLDFTLAVQQQLPPDAGLCWSPCSVAAALGLAAAGARGATEAELAKLLAPGSTLPEVAAQLAASATLPEAEAAVANSLWMDQHLQFREDFQRRVQELPGGALHRVDFRHDAEGARREINEDVARTTRGLIQELLQAGVLTRETAAVIVNALYLKIAWLHAFPEAATKPAAFHAPSGTREVPTMRQQESFPYATADGWRMVSLPTPAPVVVDVLLPPDGESAAPVPPAELLTGLQRSTRPTKLDLALPRFRVAWSVVLNEPLRRLGVETAFDKARADFSGMTPERVFIDLVVHKSVLRADEQGFEGAAATAVVMRLVSMDLSTPVPFHVDRPFLVLVRHRQTGVVFFLARVTEPSGS